MREDPVNALPGRLVRNHLPDDGLPPVMGLDDEMEKLKQAGEWIATGTDEQQGAALDQIGHVIATSKRPELRKLAWALLRKGEQRHVGKL